MDQCSLQFRPLAVLSGSSSTLRCLYDGRLRVLASGDPFKAKAFAARFSRISSSNLAEVTFGDQGRAQERVLLYGPALPGAYLESVGPDAG
jgi:hypothetical protein